MVGTCPLARLDVSNREVPLEKIPEAPSMTWAGEEVEDLSALQPPGSFFS
jgi:hypothetical protein